MGVGGSSLYRNIPGLGQSNPNGQTQGETPEQRLARILQRQQQQGSTGFLQEHFENRQPMTLPSPDERVARMCQEAKSGKKKALVIDSFYDTSGEAERAEARDFDGDLQPDRLLHGDIVRGFLEKEGIQTEAYQCSPENLPACLHNIANQVEAGVREKPAFINISMADKLQEDDLQELTGVEDLTFGNVASRRDEAIGGLYRNFSQNADVIQVSQANPPEPGTPQAMQQQIQQQEFLKRGRMLMQSASIDRLSQAGVPTVWGAGNDTSESLNSNTLTGSISVGALDENGAKASFSGDNSLVTHWRQGTYPIRRVNGGLDINGDDKADVTSAHLTGGRSYIGRSVDEPGVVEEIPDAVRQRAAEIRQLFPLTGGVIPEYEWRNEVVQELYKFGLKPGRLYSDQQLMEIRGFSPETTAESAKNYETPDGRHAFTADEDGKLQSTLPPVVSGTSFAAPSICRDENSMPKPEPGLEQKPPQRIEDGFRLLVDG